MTTSAFSGARVQPFYCPYCGEEDFVPSGSVSAQRPTDVGGTGSAPSDEAASPGTAGSAYHCRSCDRRFAVYFLGLGPGADAI